MSGYRQCDIGKGILGGVPTGQKGERLEKKESWETTPRLFDKASRNHIILYLHKTTDSNIR